MNEQKAKKCRKKNRTMSLEKLVKFLDYHCKKWKLFWNSVTFSYKLLISVLYFGTEMSTEPAYYSRVDFCCPVIFTAPELEICTVSYFFLTLQHSSDQFCWVKVSTILFLFVFKGKKNNGNEKFIVKKLSLLFIHLQLLE